MTRSVPAFAASVTVSPGSVTKYWSSPVPPPVPPVPSDKEKEKEMPPVPPEVEAILQPKNLDEVYAPRDGDEVKVKAKAKDSDAASTISTGDAGFAM